MRNSRSRGIALVLVLGVALLILLMASATTIVMRGRGETRELGIESQKALYLAEAGVEYVRAAVLDKAERVVASTNPHGIRMPTLSFVELLAHLDVEPVEGSGFEIGPVPVKGSEDQPLGHFRVRVGLLHDAVGSDGPELKGAPAPEDAAGLGWLPMLSLESTGFSGVDPENPTAQRRLIVALQPVPPKVESPAKNPEVRLLRKGDREVQEDVPPESLHPFLPSFGVPTYQVTAYVDMGGPDPHLWTLEQAQRPPQVYPPTSSLPEQAPEAWWFIPSPGDLP